MPTPIVPPCPDPSLPLHPQPRSRSYVLDRPHDRPTPAKGAPHRLAAAARQTCLPAALPADGQPTVGPGLSKGHIRTSHRLPTIPEPDPRARPTRRITVRHGAGLIEIEPRPREGDGDATEAHRRPRGKIDSWTAKSRMRCRRLLHALKREALKDAWFVTATYPAEFPAPDDHGIYKGHLHRLCQEIRRRHPNTSGLWKLEFQKRKAAHFHFLLIGCREDLVSFRQWIAATWARIVDSGDPKHQQAGTGVDLIRTYGGVMAYVTSYISKDDQTLPGNFTGRYWGVMNRAHLPVAEASVYEVSDKAAVKINRWKCTLARKYQEQSRWNQWNSMRRKVPGNHLCLSRLEFAYAWSRRKHRKGQDKYFLLVPAAGGGFLMPWSALMPEMANGSKLRPPRKVKVWNNSGGALLCNASGFWNAVERGLQQGLR